jgi:hypothetical protein
MKTLTIALIVTFGLVLGSPAHADWLSDLLDFVNNAIGNGVTVGLVCVTNAATC